MMISELFHGIENEICNRKIVIWGKTNTKADEKITAQVENFGYEIAFFVDSDYGKCDGQKVFHPSVLKGNYSKYYVVVPVMFHNEIYENLKMFGFHENSDFLYLNHQPVKLLQVYDYSDKYGNKVIGNFSGGILEFRGYNSTVIIGRDCHFSGVISVKSNCNIVIGDSVKAVNNDWEFKDGSNVSVGNSVRLSENGKLLVQEDALLEIGAKTTIEKNFYFSVDIGTRCVIGEDNLVSLDAIFRTNDGHTIFDGGKNCNSTDEINSMRQIITGKHVWIGQRSTILYNTVLGDGCIVGSNSMVKNCFSASCVVAGIPAKVIKNDIEWSREKCADDLISGKVEE